MTLEKANAATSGNLYGHPLSQYLEMYQSAAAQDLSAQSGIPYFPSIHAFRLHFLSTLYEISHPDFTVRHLETGTGIYPLEDYSTAQILLLRYLLEGTFARPTGAFLAYQDLPWGNVYLRQFQGRCIRRLAKQYGGRTQVFRQVMEGLHAVPMDFGDCAYQLEIVDQVSLCLILWEGDDEYPPSAQILFSDNFPSAFSAEDAAYTGGSSESSLLYCPSSMSTP